MPGKLIENIVIYESFLNILIYKRKQHGEYRPNFFSYKRFVSNGQQPLYGLFTYTYIVQTCALAAGAMISIISGLLSAEAAGLGLGPGFGWGLASGLGSGFGAGAATVAANATHITARYNVVLILLCNHNAGSPDGCGELSVTTFYWHLWKLQTL